MKTWVGGRALTLAAGAMLLAVGGTASERKVRMDDLPAAVQETVREHAKGHKLVAVAEETEKGKTVYEAEILIDGKTHEVIINPEGKVVEMEAEIALDSVPEAARSALEKAAEGGEIKKVEAVTKDGHTVYEAKIKKDGKKSEIVVAEDGTIQKQ